MVTSVAPGAGNWSLATEKFFFYFLGLRKGDLRKQVEIMKARYPEEGPERLARRFIAAQVPLSLIGSALVHGPTVVPGMAPILRLLGAASGTTVMVILNMTLFLQIALLFGYDIDDRARVKELLAVIAATGLASGSTSLIPHFASMQPLFQSLAGGGTIVAASQLVGETAIRYFKRTAVERDRENRAVAV